MQNKKVVAVAMLIGVLALIVSGCGSKKKSYSASKAEFGAAAGSICTTFNKKSKELAMESVEDIATKGDDFLALVEDAVKKTKGLGDPPAELKSYLDDYFAQNDKAIALFKQLIEAAKAKDEAKVQSLSEQISPINDAMDADAKALGANACLN